MEVEGIFTGRIYEDWMRTFQQDKMAGILGRVTPRGRILDVGCGAGFLEALIQGIVALDADLENMKKANGTKIRASGEYLPFETNSFDTVFCIDVIHLLRGVDELLRVLKEDGLLILTSFCSEYNKEEKLRELGGCVRGMRVIDEFFVGNKELDAVLLCTKGRNPKYRYVGTSHQLTFAQVLLPPWFTKQHRCQLTMSSKDAGRDA